MKLSKIIIALAFIGYIIFSVSSCKPYQFITAKSGAQLWGENSRGQVKTGLHPGEGLHHHRQPAIDLAPRTGGQALARVWTSMRARLANGFSLRLAQRYSTGLSSGA